MAEGAGTHEGYVESTRGGMKRTTPVWVRVPTSHEGPPYAWRTEEREA